MHYKPAAVRQPPEKKKTRKNVFFLIFPYRVIQAERTLLGPKLRKKGVATHPFDGEKFFRRKPKAVRFTPKEEC